MKGYQNLSHTRWDADGGSRPRGENQLARLLQTTKWQSVSLDRPTDVQRCSFGRPFMADYRRSPTGVSHSIAVARAYASNAPCSAYADITSRTRLSGGR
jgi:hypothetical protein